MREYNNTTDLSQGMRESGTRRGMIRTVCEMYVQGKGEAGADYGTRLSERCQEISEQPDVAIIEHPQLSQTADTDGRHTTLIQWQQCNLYAAQKVS